MNLIIRNIKLGELEEYINSEEYSRSAFVPISEIRALSHINNPRANSNDYCLFLAYTDNKIIGYLGAITDKCFSKNDSFKVYWLSCMWVLPEYRRDGVALKLLQHAYKIFEGQVLITNFIPQSKKAFEKTSQYSDLAELNGIRGYLRLDIANLLLRKHKKLFVPKSLFQLIDIIGNLLISLRFWLLAIRKKPVSCVFEEIEYFSDELKKYISENIHGSLFCRGADEFTWMMQNPWVKKVQELSEESKRYYFSQEGKDFKQWFVQLKNNRKIVGFLILSKFKGELKTPYLIYDNDIAEDVAVYITQKAIASKTSTYVGYNKTVNRYLIKSRAFIHSRKSTYGFLMGKELIKRIPANFRLFDGDGDGVFT